MRYGEWYAEGGGRVEGGSREDGSAEHGFDTEAGSGEHDSDCMGYGGNVEDAIAKWMVSNVVLNFNNLIII